MGGDVCQLCLKESELRRSHILPEFFYLNIYESPDAHRALAITRISEKIIQKGLREYLLCQECETKLSRYENYAAELIREIPSFSQDVSGRFLFSEKVDYSLFKLFQLSLIWRCGVSKNPAFVQVALGPHEEILRCRLIEQNPGKAFEYGCLMMTILETELLHKVISSPIRLQSRPFGHIAYKLMTGNLSWIFFVNSHHVDKQLQQFFVQESGLLRVWLSQDEKTPLLNIAKNMRRLKSERKK
jgi:hypothetical protein